MATCSQDGVRWCSSPHQEMYKCPFCYTGTCTLTERRRGIGVNSSDSEEFGKTFERFPFGHYRMGLRRVRLHRFGRLPVQIGEPALRLHPQHCSDPPVTGTTTTTMTTPATALPPGLTDELSDVRKKKEAKAEIKKLQQQLNTLKTNENVYRRHRNRKISLRHWTTR